MAFSRIALSSAVVLAIVCASSAALADCYVDSVAGNDGNDGSTEATAVQSQAPLSGCGTVFYKRGSVFNEPVNTSAGSTFTNYGDASQPLPAFITTDAAVSSYSGGLTIDGLHLEGAMGDGTMGGMGVCVWLMGENNQLLNSEVTDCDIGIMLFADNSVVRGNLVYDLDRMAVDSEDTGVYANAVGGAEGIFISGSNNEVAYNQFINCKAEAAWQGDGGYDGGATEVVASEGEVVSNLRVHHNFAYNTCGFFEVSGFGTFADSEFYYNVSVDSSWAMLLQVNETTLSNIRWENNTFVHHADAYSPSITMIYQAEVTPNTVFFDNNLVIFDGAPTYMGGVDSNISASNNLIVESVPGVVNIAGINPADFDLVAGSAAIDQGLTVAGHTLDFLNRVVPDPSGATDIGAFEYGSTQGEEQPDLGIGGTTGSGGADSGVGGADTGIGGADAGVGGADSGVGGTPDTGVGGTPDTGVGGADSGVGGTPDTGVGGTLDTGVGGALTGVGGALTGVGGALTGSGGSDPGATCTSPLFLCAGLCVDLASDPTNCGVCGTICPTGQFCSGGGCAAACAPGTVQCGQSCVDINSSVLHCGGCDRPCGAGQVCTAGICTGSTNGAAVTQPIQPLTTTNPESEPTEEEGGCACSVVGAQGPGRLARLGLLLVAAVPLVWRRRRRGLETRGR